MAEPLRDVATALIWLTRLPLRAVVPVPLARAVWAFPVVGLVVGLCGAAVLWAAQAVALPPLTAAFLALAAMAMVTGALHEDGLADYADGCGGTSRARALEIMRDARIGSYGVLALLLVVAIKASALSGLGIAALIGAAAVSRAGMAAGLRWLPPARADGLGRQAGRPDAGRVWLALGLGAALLLPCGLGPALAGIAACGVAQLMIARHALRRLGGQTGDVLGAMQQLGEAATILALSAAMGGGAA